MSGDAAALSDFSGLTPDVVLNLVEEDLGIRCTNLCRPLTSYINRVYEVETEDGAWVIAKFYRPGRWSRDGLEDEQIFMTELAEREIPVIAPLPSPHRDNLRSRHGMYYTLFPKRGGRPLEEPSDDQWQELGRLLARIHQVGDMHPPVDRITIHPRHSTAEHLTTILEADFPFPSLRAEYESSVRDMIDRVAPLFDDMQNLRIHGDCHHLNILCRPGEPLFLIDFDDMASGPAVQDLWMLLPDHLRHTRHQLNLLLAGYETFRPFDDREIRLIEPLRAMRFVHYTAWCVRQARDGGFNRLAPDFGSAAYWKQEIRDIERQMQEIEDSFT